MQKIPTLFLRDLGSRHQYVTPEPHPDCGWVLAGEGIPTRKIDGTCTLYDEDQWWARRAVKPGKQPPPNYRVVETDPVTGTAFGWEPIDQSPFVKPHTEALTAAQGRGHPVLDMWPKTLPVNGATYELVGPKINGNPERIDGPHVLVRHGYISTDDRYELNYAPRDFTGLATWLREHPEWEGIVWHHLDGRMAKLKRRDFPRAG